MSVFTRISPAIPASAPPEIDAAIVAATTAPIVIGAIAPDSTNAATGSISAVGLTKTYIDLLRN